MEADVVWIYWEVKRFKGSSISRKASKKCREIGNCLIAGHIIGCCQDPITILLQYTGENISKRFCKNSANISKRLPRKCPKWLEPLPTYKTYKAKAWSFAIAAWYRFPFLQVRRDSRSWRKGVFRNSSVSLPATLSTFTTPTRLDPDSCPIQVRWTQSGWQKMTFGERKKCLQFFRLTRVFANLRQKTQFLRPLPKSLDSFVWSCLALKA